MANDFDPDKYLAESAPLADDSFDPDAYLADSPAPIVEQPKAEGPSELSMGEIAKTIMGSAAGYGGGKAIQAVADKGAQTLLDPAAEDLAYRGAGGYSGTKAGTKLNSTLNDKKAGKIAQGVEELANIGVFDDGVTNRSVGREILDKKLLGTFGLGTKASNDVKAKANLIKTSEPTNAVLDSISEYPISKEKVLDRAKEIADYDNLDLSIENNRKLKKLLDLEKQYAEGVQTPMQTERAKRDLQSGADFGDTSKTAKNARDVAQSTARKEAVEKAVENSLGPEALKEFKQNKIRSGSAGVASEMIEDLYNKSQKPFSGFNSITGTGIDFVKQRGAGITAGALDTLSKSVKAGAKGIPVLGTLLGGVVGAAAADEQTDSADFIPGLDQAGPAGSAFDDKELQAEVKALQNYDASPAGRGAKPKIEEQLKQFNELKQPNFNDRNNYLQSSLESVDPSFKDGFAYKQAQQELERNRAISAPKSSQNIVVEGSKALNAASPDQLMELSDSFKGIKGADTFVAPLENAAQASSPEEMKARLFGLYQQPAFRQLLKKGNTSEE